MRSRLLTSLFLLLVCLASSHATKYCRSGAGGSGNGSDWTNAYTSLSALESGLVRGEIGYVADGSYSAVTCNTAPSGTTTITIKKATVADHGTSTGWSDTFGDGAAAISGPVTFQSGYWIFDGATGGGPGSWKTGYGFVVSYSQGPIVNSNWDVAAPNVQVRHVEMIGAFGDVFSNDGIGIANQCPNWIVSYCYMHDIGRTPGFVSGDNALFEYCYFSTFESTGPQHAESISSWRGSVGVTGLKVRWSVCDYMIPTGGFIYDGGEGEFYGNVFFRPTGVTFGGQAAIGTWGASRFQNCKVYNNTFYDLGGTQAHAEFNGNDTGNEFLNNLYISTGVGNPPGGSHSHNHFSGGTGNYGSNATTGTVTLVAPQSQNWAPTSNTTSGTTLGAPYNVDMLGNTRTPGSWTRGAIQVGGADTTAPTQITSVIDSVTTLQRTFSEPVVTGTGDDSGFTITLSGGAVTGTYSSGSGTAIITYTLSRSIDGGETGTDAYVQPGNGVEDSAGNDLASYSLRTITNNAPVNQVATPTASPTSGYFFGTTSITLSCATSAATIYYTTDGSTPTTSSSVYSSAIALTSGCTLKAFAIKSGMGNSLVMTQDYQVNSWSSDNDFRNFSVPQQTGVFPWRFRATPPEDNCATHIGLSPTAVDEFGDWAVIIRFNNIDSTVDVRNGAAYAAVNSFPYTGGTTYDIVASIDVPNKKVVSVTIVPATGGTPVTIATNYDFRTEQSGATELDGVGMLTTVSTQPTAVSNMSFTALSTGGTLSTTNLIITPIP